MENINEKVGTANTTYVGVGHSLQLRYGPHAGRLVGICTMMFMFLFLLVC